MPIVLLCLAAVSGCRKVERPAEARAVEKPATPSHAEVDHSHEPPHGGVVRDTARGHLELIVEEGRHFRVWLLDEQMSPRPVSGLGGTVKVALPEYADVKLEAVGDHLEGTGAPLTGEHVTVVVSVFGEGAPETARFRLHLGESGTPHRLPVAVPGKQSVIGLITDSTCLLDGERPGPEHAECAVRCIQGGAPIAIVEEKTGEVFVATAPQGKSVTELLIPFVGQRSEIYGKVLRQGGTQFLVVEDVVPEHQHSPKEGGVVAMMGELHLEVVALKSGEIRLFLSDDFRKPLPATGRRGSVELRVPEADREGEAVRTLPLLPEPNGGFLFASFEPFSAELVELTVRLPLPEDSGYFITFMLEPVDPSAEVAEKAGAAANAPVTEAIIEVKGGYRPDRIVLKKGAKATLVFDRRDTGFCTSEVMIPKLGIRQKLAELSKTRVEIAPTEAGEIPFSCGMGMLKGTLVVTP